MTRLREQFSRDRINADEIKDWIKVKTLSPQILNLFLNKISFFLFQQENITDITSADFIRALVTVGIDHCIVNRKSLDLNRFNKVVDVIRPFLDADERREIEALYAIQALVVDLEIPKGNFF